MAGMSAWHVECIRVWPIPLEYGNSFLRALKGLSLLDRFQARFDAAAHTAIFSRPR